MIFLIPIYAFVQYLKIIDYDLSNSCASLLAFPIWFFFNISYLVLFIGIGIITSILSISFKCIKEAIFEEMFDNFGID